MAERPESGDGEGRGVQLPRFGERRSSLRCTRDLLAAAAEAVDPALASAIRDERDWRNRYPVHLRALTGLTARSRRAGLAAAQAGLRRVYESFEFCRDAGTARRIPDALARRDGATIGSRLVGGEGNQVEELVVPYRGREQRGRAQLDTIAEWEQRGVLERAFGAALRAVVQNPHWIKLAGRRVCVLGAGAEMAPTELLLRWGAEVIAVDLPNPQIWLRLARAALEGTGTLVIPQSCDAAGARHDGVDLLTQTPELAHWLEGFGGPVLIGNYVYAPGQDFLRVAVAADALWLHLEDAGREPGLVCLASPTDVFAVPMQAVEAARSRLHGDGALCRLARPIELVTGGRVMLPNYRDTVITEDGTEIGIADGLVVQQGPNYALAKRLQHWRAQVAGALGRTAMLHVAPPTRTRSVLQSKLISAVYEGAGMFGMEAFEPDTSRALMAAALVHDLHAAENGSRQERGLVGPLQHELTEAAMHGGLWRIAWEPRTALPFAALRGARAFLR